MASLAPGALARYGRWVVGLVVGAVVLALLFSRRGELAGASSRIAHLSVPVALLAVAAEVASLLSFALAQRRVLMTDRRLGVTALLLITMANDAIALTVPGEPAVSSAYRYRQYRRRGVTPAAAAWSILTLIVAQAVGMSLLLAVGVVVALVTSAHVPAVTATVGLLVVVLAAAVTLLRRNTLIRALDGLVSVVRRMTGRPRGDVGARVDRLLSTMRSITMSTGGYATVTSLATATWLFDATCLVASFAAVHAPIPWRGVILAYGVAQLLAVLPIAPGGLGLVEGGLSVVLVAYGAPRVPVLAAVLVYRLISYWLAILAGWSTAGLLALANRNADRRAAVADVPA